MTLFKNLLAAAVLATVAVQAMATPIIDKQNVGNFGVGFCGTGCDWQQTVVAGMSGQLTGITVFGSGTGTVRIDLGSGFIMGDWDATVTGAAATANSATVYNVIDLRSYGIFLTAGQTYVFDTLNFSGGVNGRATTAGQLYVSKSGGPALNYSQYSLGYVTYIDPTATRAAVPEPASLALLGLGLCGVAAARRRRKA